MKTVYSLIIALLVFNIGMDSAMASGKRGDAHLKKVKESKKRIFKKVLTKLKGPITIEEMDNGNDDILKLRLRDQKDKYEVTKVYYRLESLQSERETSSPYKDGSQTYVDIDIQAIPVGEYKAFFRFLAKKKKSNWWKRWFSKNTRTFLSYGVFNKEESNEAPIAIANHSVGDTWSQAKMDASSSSDPDGSIASYNYTFTHESGQVVSKTTSTSVETFELNPLPGQWNYELVVVDNKDKSSEPYTGSFVMGQPPVLAFSLVAIYAPLKYSINASSSTSPIEEPLSFHVVILKDGSPYATHSSEEAVFELPTLKQNGSYEFQVQAIGESGLKSSAQSASVTVDMPAVGDDVLPPDPGEEGRKTIEGIDLDEDGVRDDIEHFVYEFVEDKESSIRRELLRYSQEFGVLIRNPDDSDIIYSKFQKMIDVSKCIQQEFPENDAAIINQEILLAHINTDERFERYLKTRDKVFGETFDLEEVNCEN